jgi:SAM-dependent methyltransferase
MNSLKYYQKAADYYDHEACSYEDRYWKNPIAQRIRQSFREAVKAQSFDTVLEVGCGTGLDLAHFASIYPDKQVYGIDISPAMVAKAAAKIQQQQLNNARVAQGSPENLADLFPDVKFDHIFVFFGALNTVADLGRTAHLLRERLQSGGTMVLTFVNKWYLADAMLHLLRFRFQSAFKRLRPVWGGYSDRYFLESRCYSPRDVRAAFEEEFEIVNRRGYSIVYPAWYRTHWLNRFGRRVCELLWDCDRWLNLTPAWCLGEYTLYSFKARS